MHDRRGRPAPRHGGEPALQLAGEPAVSGTGRTKTGRLWVYARDDRNWQGSDPPAAVYFYTPDRRGERPRSPLAGYSGFLQADGYTGYGQLYGSVRPAGTIVEVACWVHTRRKLFDECKNTGSETARAGVKLIDAIYLAEGPARGQPLDERTRLRATSRIAVEASSAGLRKRFLVSRPSASSPRRSATP